MTPSKRQESKNWKIRFYGYSRRDGSAQLKARRGWTLFIFQENTLAIPLLAGANLKKPYRKPTLVDKLSIQR